MKVTLNPAPPSAAQSASRTLPAASLPTAGARVRRWFGREEEGPSVVIAVVLVLAGTGLVEFTAYLLTRFP